MSKDGSVTEFRTLHPKGFYRHNILKLDGRFYVYDDHNSIGDLMVFSETEVVEIPSRSEGE